MKPPISSNDHGTFHECLLLAAVCDVRNFSMLQAHIDEHIVSSLTLKEHNQKLGKRKLEYMNDTRERATKIFLKSLTKSMEKGEELKYAIKSTGDGFLVAVEVWDFDSKDPPPLLESKFPELWTRRAWALAEALWVLHEDSKVTNRREKQRTLGGLTSAFLKDFATELGLSKKDYTERGYFRVPGALAMGSGTITPAHGNERGDAYGNPVNIAFRLCEQAGKFNDKNDRTKQISPPVLLDRRVGRLLASFKPARSAWVVLPLDEVTLKGIEEKWCYALQKRKQRRRRKLATKSAKAK